MDTNHSDNNSRAEGTENNLDKKNKDIDKADKKNCPEFFLSGQRGIYHQVEFRQVFGAFRYKARIRSVDQKNPVVVIRFFQIVFDFVCLDLSQTVTRQVLARYWAIATRSCSATSVAARF